MSESKSGKAVTIETVAAQAGVSKTTVSFVLNNNPSISDATRENVLKVMKNLGYHPNIHARNLSSSTSRVLCVVLPELGQIFEDPYFARALAGVYDEVEGADYRLLLKKASYDFALNKEYLNMFRRREISGMLYVGSTLDDSYLKDFLDTSYPFVLVNSYLPGLGVPHVTIDHAKMGYVATEHLISLGHRRIGHITGSMNVVSTVDRLQGYKQALEDAGIGYEERLVVNGHFNRSGAAAAARSLLDLKAAPTAIYAANDTMAIGAREALQEDGVRVPRQCSLVGCDNIELTAHTRPAMTTVDQRLYEVAREAVRLLIERIEGRTQEIGRVLTPTLVVRKSCGADPNFTIAMPRRRRRNQDEVVGA
jgi:DNA-binding LacI/PurR family transcriptional regulator